MSEPRRARQRGVAVVLAMGVVALAAIAAAAMLASQSAWSRRVELGSAHVQARALVQVGVDWARALLGDDRRTSSADHLGEPWAMRLPPVPLENGELAGRIEDQQGLFNLNNLVKNGTPSPTHLSQLRRLLAMTGAPAALADALAGRVAQAPLVDAGELALLPGLDEPARARLAPFVTALPRTTSLNVNTASAEVLSAVVRGLDIDAARTLVAQRERAYFRNLTEFLQQLPPGATVDGNDITTASQYFLASVRVTIGDAQAHGSALLARETEGWPVIAWRKFL